MYIHQIQYCTKMDVFEAIEYLREEYGINFPVNGELTLGENSTPHKIMKSERSFNEFLDEYDKNNDENDDKKHTLKKSKKHGGDDDNLERNEDDENNDRFTLVKNNTTGGNEIQLTIIKSGVSG